MKERKGRIMNQIETNQNHKMSMAPLACTSEESMMEGSFNVMKGHLLALDKTILRLQRLGEAGDDFPIK